MMQWYSSAAAADAETATTSTNGKPLLLLLPLRRLLLLFVLIFIFTTRTTKTSRTWTSSSSSSFDHELLGVYFVCAGDPTLFLQSPELQLQFQRRRRQRQRLERELLERPGQRQSKRQSTVLLPHDHVPNDMIVSPTIGGADTSDTSDTATTKPSTATASTTSIRIGRTTSLHLLPLPFVPTPAAAAGSTDSSDKDQELENGQDQDDIVVLREDEADEGDAFSSSTSEGGEEGFVFESVERGTSNNDKEQDKKKDIHNPWSKYMYNWEIYINTPTHVPKWRWYMMMAPALSMAGSLWIILEVLLFDRKKKRKSSYDRLVCGLSMFDFGSSIWFVVSSSSIFSPRHYHGGDTVVYIAVARMMMMMMYWSSLAVPIYNVSLTVYFYLSTVKGWSEDKIRNQFEKWIHRRVPIITAILALVQIPLPLPLPFRFYNGNGNGPTSHDLWWGIFWGVVLWSAAAMTLMMGSIIWYGHDGHTRTTHSHKTVCKTVKRARTPTTAMLLYTIPFIISWVLPVVWQILSHFNNWKKLRLTPPLCTKHVLLVWMTVFMLLQGFFNWLIYMLLPKFQRSVCDNKNQRLMKAFFFGRSIGAKCFHRSQNDYSDEHENDDDDGDDVQKNTGSCSTSTLARRNDPHAGGSIVDVDVVMAGPGNNENDIIIEKDLDILI